MISSFLITLLRQLLIGQIMQRHVRIKQEVAMPVKFSSNNFFVWAFTVVAVVVAVALISSTFHASAV